MANISDWLNKIKSAIYGREVRTALHDSINAVNKETESNTESCKKLRTDLTDHSNAKATGSVSGHVTLSDSVSNTSNDSNSVAATPYAVKVAYDKAVDARSAADTNRESLLNEVSNRIEADNKLADRISQEAKERQRANDELSSRITAEKNERVKADEIMSGDIDTLKSKAHTHDNKEVLDGITSDDVEKWNSIKNQVTQEQLNEHAAYNDEQIAGLMREIMILQTALGITSYDGGLFEQDYDGIELDGGDFENEQESEFDCGDFEPLIISTQINAVLDGGKY